MDDNTCGDRGGIAIANRVSVVSIIVNAALSAFKLAAGILAHSAAMVSDAVHSLSDVLSTFIVIIGVNLAGQKSDRAHPYGHERFECVASIILALMLGLTGVWIGYSGVKSMVDGGYENRVLPGGMALVAAVVSIAVKEWMYRYTRAAAKKINSGALLADAWHHRSDALSSVGAFIGILGAVLGFPALDAAASLVICLFIAKAAYDIFMDAINKMVDKSCDEETLNALRALVTAQSGVIAVDDIRTRIFGSKMFVDIEIAADKDLALTQAHKIAESVHDAVEKNFPTVKHCMVHVNPGVAG
ncbi:MAG: cation diffusion facilitator family transporter [Chitinispirillales bacterium]|nr:cation diffusion facilitator family transporter [Chitinispirillales bacterium]